MTPNATSVPQRIIVAISGASGAIYGVRLLQMLRALGNVQTHLTISDAGLLNLQQELDMSRADLETMADVSYPVRDVGAAIARGSFQCDGMVVAPCSMRMLGAVANGLSDNLMSRAADVMLKERRPLVLMVRETPLHLGHLRTMTALAEMGAIILPPVPAFYAEPKTLTDLVDQMVGRCLDLFDYDWPDVKRWGEELAKGRRKKKQ